MVTDGASIHFSDFFIRLFIDDNHVWSITSRFKSFSRLFHGVDYRHTILFRYLKTDTIVDNWNPVNRLRDDGRYSEQPRSPPGSLALAALRVFPARRGFHTYGICGLSADPFCCGAHGGETGSSWARSAGSESYQ